MIPPPQKKKKMWVEGGKKKTPFHSLQLQLSSKSCIGVKWEILELGGSRVGTHLKIDAGSRHRHVGIIHAW